ncbi:MAG: acyl-CoA dehydrogenase [Chloroflexota bacterium]
MSLAERALAAGISFTLTDEQRALRELAHEFAEKEIRPKAAEYDRRSTHPADIIAKAHELGLMNLHIPPEYGGPGLGALDGCLVDEELCWGCSGIGTAIMANGLAAGPLIVAGSEEQKRRWLPGLATGEVQTASAGTEPEAGSDAANIQTRAVREDGYYLVNGTKAFCTFADVADVLFTYVRTDDAVPKHRGISLLLVEKPRGESFIPPYLTGKRIRTLGYRGMNTYLLYFNGLKVPAENLVGEEGKGFYYLMQGYEVARIQFAFRATGLARAAYEAALKYAQDRVQFGRPIAQFQAIRFKLADMVTEIEAARQLAFYAAERFDRGERCDLEAGMAKLFATEVAVRAARESLQIHGGVGYTMELPVQRYLRDALLLPIGEGTNEIQREVIARRILGER